MFLGTVRAALFYFAAELVDKLTTDFLEARLVTMLVLKKFLFSVEEIGRKRGPYLSAKSLNISLIWLTQTW